MVLQMTNKILEIRNVAKTFGGLRAVEGVSFEVAQGELLGIAGPNGSGKSTLFNLMTRIPYGPSSGEVVFRGQRIERTPAHKIASMGMARTFQKDVEFPDLTAAETVALAATYGAAMDKAETRIAVETQLEATAFAPDRIDLPTTELSVYERKQLMIASALVMQPKVLMLDEPASGLTRPEIARLGELLLAINRRGVTVLLIEHVLPLLMSVSQRLIVLNQGRLLAEGDPTEVFKRNDVIEAYLGGRAA